MTGEELTAQLDLMVGRLGHLRADYEGAPEASTQAAAHQRDRYAAHQALNAVIDFLNSVPAWENADIAFALRRLMVALNNINAGQTELWLTNPAPNRAQDRIEIIAGRGRCAGVMQMLVDAGWNTEGAAKFIVANMPAATFLRLAPRTPRSRPDWQRVRSWRETARQPKSRCEGKKALVSAFQAQLNIAKGMNRPIAEVARISLKAVARSL